MALPNPKTRQETFLAAAAGESVTLPDPVTHKEVFLAKAAGMSVAELEPVTREEMYLNAITGGGGGGEITKEALSVNSNGTYTAPSGKAYSPVTVNVPNTYAAGDEGKVVNNGSLVAQTSDTATSNGTVDTTLINSLTVSVPQPTLVSKTITENGTYSAEDDNADGYSAVTVDVQGGITPVVPSGYTQLKYVESTGTQAINTGVVPSLGIKVEASFVKTETSSGTYAFPFGCAHPVIGACVNTSLLQGGFCSFGDKTDKSLTHPQPSDAVPTYTIDKDTATGQSASYLPQTSVAIGATTMPDVNSNTRICIFCRGNGTNMERYCSCRMYRMKIWNSGTLVRDFVPAVDSNNEVGMYDIENNVFYTNVGTGVFIGGAY